MEMINTAKREIKDWHKVSKVNKGMTLGTSWNILAKDFDVTKKYHVLHKANLLREFGQFLYGQHSQPKKIKTSQPKVVHQDPIF